MSDEFNSSSSSGKIRQLVLVVLLVLVAGAFAYDFLIVKPKFAEAVKKVEEMELDGAERTSEDIHKIIDREPSRVDDKTRDDAVVETYSWPRGIPFLNYNLHIVYTKIKGNDALHYYSSSANKKPALPEKLKAVEPVLDPPEISRAGG